MNADTRVIRKVAFESGPVEMSVRLWQFKGIRLMTHEPPEKSHHIIMPGNFRVSEETTGFGVPNTWGQNEEKSHPVALFSGYCRLLDEAGMVADNEPTEFAAIVFVATRHGVKLHNEEPEPPVSRA